MILMITTVSLPERSAHFPSKLDMIDGNACSLPILGAEMTIHYIIDYIYHYIYIYKYITYIYIYILYIWLLKLCAIMFDNQIHITVPPNNQITICICSYRNKAGATATHLPARHQGCPR